MAFMKTNSVKITVDNNTYDSLEDFGLAIENTDYLKSPQQSLANIVSVPGRDGMLDMTDPVFGGQYFMSRKINIKFGGMEESENWDSVISTFRNLFEGKVVKLEFATMPGWYWTGRAEINSFQHRRALGMFSLDIPDADPFCYQDHTLTKYASNSGTSVTISITRKIAVPTITVNTITRIEKDGVTYTFDAGTHRNPELRLLPGNNTLILKGPGNQVTIDYQDGSL